MSENEIIINDLIKSVENETEKHFNEIKKEVDLFDKLKQKSNTADLIILRDRIIDKIITDEVLKNTMPKIKYKDVIDAVLKRLFVAEQDNR